MHLDHAGGLDQFLDRKDIEIWVHDKELRSAFWSVATGADVGVYLKHYMDVSLPSAPPNMFSFMFSPLLLSFQLLPPLCSSDLERRNQG